MYRLISTITATVDYLDIQPTGNGAENVLEKQNQATTFLSVQLKLKNCNGMCVQLHSKYKMFEFSIV